MKRSALGLLILLAACPPESENPLSPPDKAVLDKALLGVWEGEDGNGSKLEMHITVKEGGVLSIVDPRDGEKLKMQAHTTTLGTAKYLNVQFLEKDDEPTGFVIVRYALTKAGALDVWTMESGPVRKAMEAGTLKAKGTAGGTGGLIITDTPAKIASFIKAQKGDSLWEKFGTFKRTRAP